MASADYGVSGESIKNLRRCTEILSCSTLKWLDTDGSCTSSRFAFGWSLACRGDQDIQIERPLSLPFSSKLPLTIYNMLSTCCWMLLALPWSPCKETQALRSFVLELHSAEWVGPGCICMFFHRCTRQAGGQFFFTSTTLSLSPLLSSPLFSALLFSSLLFSALLFSSLLCSALLCSSLLSSPLVSSLLFSALLFSSLLFASLRFSSLLCSSLLFSALLFSSLLCSALLFSYLLSSPLFSSLLCSALLFSSLLCSSLRFSSLLFSSLLFSSLSLSLSPSLSTGFYRSPMTWARAEMQLFCAHNSSHIDMNLWGSFRSAQDASTQNKAHLKIWGTHLLIAMVMSAGHFPESSPGWPSGAQVASQAPKGPAKWQLRKLHPYCRRPAPYFNMHHIASPCW